jgi:hypothetical protein
MNLIHAHAKGKAALLSDCIKWKNATYSLMESNTASWSSLTKGEVILFLYR